MGLGCRSADDGDVTGTGCGEEGSDGVREEDNGEVLSDGEVDGDSGGDRRRGEGGDDGGSGEGEGGWAVSGFGEKEGKVSLTMTGRGPELASEGEMGWTDSKGKIFS